MADEPFRMFRSSRALAVGTSARIVASPLVLGLTHRQHYRTAGVVFAAAASTDFVDGRLARRWELETNLGSFLDTTADKVLVATALIGLVAEQRVSPWVAFTIISREFSILGLRTAVVSSQLNFKTSRLGKWKTTFQLVAILAAILRPELRWRGAYLDQWAMGFATAATAVSGIDYLIRSRDALRS